MLPCRFCFQSLGKGHLPGRFFNGMVDVVVDLEEVGQFVRTDKAAGSFIDDYPGAGGQDNVLSPGILKLEITQVEKPGGAFVPGK